MLLFGGWVNRAQAHALEFVQEENRVLREQLGSKHLRFTDAQRRRLAARARAVGRRGLFEISTLVTPDTLLRWHRMLIGKKYDGRAARMLGRPKTPSEIAETRGPDGSGKWRLGDTRVSKASCTISATKWVATRSSVSVPSSAPIDAPGCLIEREDASGWRPRFGDAERVGSTGSSVGTRPSDGAEARGGGSAASLRQS